jgi:NSS family neurotransmitter:Na+ symporter
MLPEAQLAYRIAHQPLFFPVPIALFFGIALVVLLFTFGEGDFAFHQVVFPIERGGHHRVALLFHRLPQFAYLSLLEQQLAGAGGVADKVGGDGGQWLDLGAEQPSLAILEDHIAVRQLAFPRPQAFDFPAGQGDARLKTLLDKEVEFGAFIESYGAALRIFVVFRRHRARIITATGFFSRSAALFGATVQRGYNAALCVGHLCIKAINGGSAMTQKGIHGVWASRWTFVLAATGSAVGLGNIWKFPYMSGENGGGAFVLVYLVCICLIGLPVMMAEVLIGRRGRQSPINSMRFVTQEAGMHGIWTSIGWMGVIAGLLIMAFYSVVAGWALQYVWATASGVFTHMDPGQIGGHFSALLGNPSQLLVWHTIFSFLTAGVVALGVNRGLGAVANIMMPVLFLALLVLVGYSLLHGDFAAGFHFLFDFEIERLSWPGVLKAMGHAFFTLSLGMGAIMAYGAYMPAHASIARTVITVGILDTLVALTAGLAIFPIVFANPPLEPSAGPGLLFVSLPIAFAAMPWGAIFGTVFFILVSLAAWSSSVSLIEPGVAWLVESRKFRRPTATFLLTGIAWLLGISCVLSFNLWSEFKPALMLYKTPFDFLDFLTSQLMLPLGGLFIALFVGWCMRKAVVEREMDAEGHPIFDIWRFVVRFISPALVALVMILTLIDSF